MMQTNDMNTSDLRNPTIYINKLAPCSDDRMCISLGNTLSAQMNLSPVAFFLYMSFILYDNMETFDFSVPHFCESFGLTHKEYVSAYNELIYNEYLTTTVPGSDFLCFHDKPHVTPCSLDWDGRDDWEKNDGEDVW